MSDTQLYGLHALKNLNLRWGKQPLPIVYQNEIAECGLACLAMVANYHGFKTDLRALRKRYPVTLKGTTLSNVVTIAESLKFSCRPIKVEIEDIKLVRTPAVLHWDLNHFVVLKKATDSYAIIYDPAIGVRKMTISEVSSHFSGVALEIWPNTDFEQVDEKKPLRMSSFVKNVVGFKRSLSQIFVLSLVLQLLGIISPYYTQLVVDQVIVGKDLDFLVVLGVGFGFLAFLTLCISLMREWVGIFFHNIYSIQLSSTLAKHMMHLPIGWFDTRHIGDILSRFNSVTKVKNTITSGIISGSLNVIAGVATLVVMLLYSVKLTLVTLAGVFGYIVIRGIFYRPFKQATEEAIVKGAEETSSFVETVNSISSLKIFSAENRRLGIWVNKVTNTMNANIAISKLSMIFNVCRTTMVTIEGIAILWIGAHLVIGDYFTLGMLFAFMAWRGQFVAAIYGIVNGIFAFKMLSIDLERVADIALEEVDDSSEIGESEFRPERIKGALQVEGLRFRYGSDESPLFEDFNLGIAAGESVLIVAPSGFGKTTLMKILMGLLKPEAGKVKIDGNDIRSIGIKNYRSLIGCVLQNDKLLAGTIEENISFFSEDYDLKRIRHCAEIANVSEEIEKMPLGYKSLVGETGALLSGGQAQRVLLARALYRQPKILFLDEATSNLDIDSELKIARNLEEMPITRVIISHRSEVRDYVDRVIDLNITEVNDEKGV